MKKFLATLTFATLAMGQARAEDAPAPAAEPTTETAPATEAAPATDAAPATEAAPATDAAPAPAADAAPTPGETAQAKAEDCAALTGDAKTACEEKVKLAATKAKGKAKRSNNNRMESEFSDE